ncbi:hypothetical protein ACB094_04G135600 [Castanea mollissima]
MGKEVAIFVLTFLLASTLYPETTLAETKSFLVGGLIGWTKEHNGSWFPNGTTFYEGDTLVFEFNQTNYNVVVVNKHTYETCKATECNAPECKAPEGAFEYNSGNDEVPVEKGESYFICTKRGCCENNMKMMIFAAAGPRPTSRKLLCLH